MIKSVRADKSLTWYQLFIISKLAALSQTDRNSHQSQ